MAGTSTIALLLPLWSTELHHHAPTQHLPRARRAPGSWSSRRGSVDPGKGTCGGACPAPSVRAREAPPDLLIIEQITWHLPTRQLLRRGFCRPCEVVCTYIKYASV